nr:hypothetical protein [Acidobacteriota bacterium]
MSDSYTIVLWCADAVRFASMVASHLLSEGLDATNLGRIDNHVPVTIGVANTHRWPVFSRQVSATGVIHGRNPRIATPLRHDYFLTVGSGAVVDSGGAPQQVQGSGVFSIEHLAEILESEVPSRMSRAEVVSLLDGAARPPVRGVAVRRAESKRVHEIAEECQRLVTALSR